MDKCDEYIHTCLENEADLKSNMHSKIDSHIGIVLCEKKVKSS